MSLHGDGINDELFFLLWAKDDLNYGPSLNIPDTVVYKFGQPVAWYFTATDGKIRRKNKQNLINIRIEEAFNKYMSCVDMVAYYISLPTGVDDDADPDTRIEYLDRKGLHDFLYNRWKESNGILQRFIEPKGTNNSMIRVIWSPKVCLAERRTNNRQIFDRRFGLYERAVTYEGQDYHSRVAPLRGNILATHIQKVCEDMVEHVAEVSFQKQRIARLVANFKVDSRDRLYLLWSTSIRLEGKSHAVPNHDSLSISRCVRKNSLNIDSQLKLPKYIRLADKANHSVEQPAPVHFIDCISCGKKSALDCFHELPYKTVMGHYEGLIWLLTTDPTVEPKAIKWPPDPRVIEAAGGVGFGCLSIREKDGDLDGSFHSATNNRTNEGSQPQRREGQQQQHPQGGQTLSTGSHTQQPGGGQAHSQGDARGSVSGGEGGGEGGKGVQRGKRKQVLAVEDVAIPPIVRHLHPKLTLQAYKRYKKDPLFLYKNAMVCEKCYLVYAEFANSSFRANPMLFMVMQSPELAAMFGRRRTAASHRFKHMCKRGPETTDDIDTLKPADTRRRPRSAGDKHLESFAAPSIGRPAIHQPTFPGGIHNAQEAQEEYGDLLDRLHSDAPAGDAIEDLIKSREDAFFRDAYKSKELSKHHPLLHMITAHHKIADANEGSVQDPLKHSNSESALALGKSFAGYGDEIVWKAPKKKAAKGSGQSTSSAEASASGAVAPGGKTRFVASEASAKHQEFLLKTLQEVQAQLSSPGAMTKSILSTLGEMKGGKAVLAANQKDDKKPPESARSKASPRSRSRSPVAADKERSPEASPQGRGGKKTSLRPGTKKDREEEDALPRVVLQDEMEVDGRVVSVTGYEEERVAGSGGSTHLLLSLMKTDMDVQQTSAELSERVSQVTSLTEGTLYSDGGKGGRGAGAGARSPARGQVDGKALRSQKQWKVVVTDADLGLVDGALRAMTRREKEHTGQRAAEALRWGGQPGMEFVYLDRQALGL